MTNPPVMFTFFYGFQLADKEKAKKSKQTILDLLCCIKGAKMYFLNVLLFCCECNFLTKSHFNNNGSNHCKQMYLIKKKMRLITDRRSKVDGNLAAK